MRNHKSIPSAHAWLACVLAAAACSSSDPMPSSEALGSALENPIIACQSRFNACPRATPSQALQCDATMRTCLQGVASWLQQSRQLLQQCSVDAEKCRIAKPGAGSELCRMQFESCITPLFSSGEDAGIDDDGGAPTGVAGSGAAGSGMKHPSGPSSGTAGRGPGLAPGFPTFPPLPGLPTRPIQPGLPFGSGSTMAAGSGAPTAAAGAPTNCMSDMLQCMVPPGANLGDCAMHARECLRQGAGARP
jgi:hypothetical protein